MAVPARTDAVLECLKQCARDMTTITYGDLAERVGLARSGVGIGKPLGYIRDTICIPRGLPWISFIAVKKETRRPSQAYLPDGTDLGDAAEHFWRGMVLQVYGFDWSNVKLKDES